MTADNPPAGTPPPEQDEAPEPGLDPAAVPEVRVVQRKGISIVWIVPLVALLIGCWLVVQSIKSRGVPIHVTFQNAEGLEAGKTRVKYKAVDIGVVDDIRLSDDLDYIAVSATLNQEIAPYLTENTRFWVVRPRVGAGGVSGLSTVLSGVYIEFDPAEGKPAREFQGLEHPPVTPANAPGLKLVLHAESLGSLDIGSPVFYRDIGVGKVDGYRLLEKDRGVDIEVFVDAPYHELVRTNTLFWNASGIDVSLTADGLSLRTQSMQTLFMGGIAFETPFEEPAGPCQSGCRFELFGKYQDIQDAAYTEKIRYVAYFDDTVRGLGPGAPVEFRGVRVGSVTNVDFELDYPSWEVRIPVQFDLEPGRLQTFGTGGVGAEEAVRLLVEQRGLRAQIQMGNIVTGQRIIALDFHDDAPAATVRLRGRLLEFPTLPGTFQHFTDAAMDILQKFRTMPIDELVGTVNHTVAGVDELIRNPEFTAAFRQATKTLEELERLTGSVDAEVHDLATEIKSLVATATTATAKAERLVEEFTTTLHPDSALVYDLAAALEELAAASRSIRLLADYLERHPEALIRGKEEPGGNR